MKIQRKSEKGQAIVMIAFAIIGMFALVALAMDGGHAFSDRRQAQNAADSAALAAARGYAHDYKTYPKSALAHYQDIALASTTSNGYNGIAPRSNVKLTIVRDATKAECPGMEHNPIPPGLVFQVDVDSWLPTWFGPVIGVSQVHNHVVSTSLSCLPYVSDAFNGNTIVVLNKTAKAAFEISGSASVTVTSDTGEGLYVESNSPAAKYPTNDPNDLDDAIKIGRPLKAPKVTTRGGIYHPSDITIFPLPNPVPPAPWTPASMIKPYAAPVTMRLPLPIIGTDVCQSGTPDVGLATTDTPNDTLTPGMYPGSVSAWQSKSFPPFGPSTPIKYVQAGVYCLSNKFNINGSDALYDTLNPVTGATGVTFVQLHNVINIGGGEIHLNAPTTPPTLVNRGILFFIPESNTDVNAYYGSNSTSTSGATVQGGGTSEYHGSILAPWTHVTINGGSDTLGPFQVQVVADTITITGSSAVTLQYNADKVYMPPVPATIELFK